MLISDSIEKYLVASNLREESMHSAKKFYISDMGKCMRMRYFKRKGIKTEFEPFVYWTFAMGNLVHNFGYEALEKQGLLIQTEEVFGTEHFSGRYDGKVLNELKKRTVFDFKSVGSYPMKKAIAGADSDENVAQLLSTVMLLKDAGEDISDSGILVYFNKEAGTGMGKIPTFVHDREYHLTSIREKKLRTEMDTIVSHWVDNKIPKCTCPAWIKDYNSYLPFCQMTDMKAKEYLKLIEDGTVKLISTKAHVFKVVGEKRTKVI